MRRVVGRAHSGRVRDPRRGEEESGEGRDGGMADTPFTRKGDVGVEKEK